jgi:hypothetical protein
MTELVASVRLNADGTALVNGIKPARSEIDALKNSAKAASVETAGLSTSARKAANDVGGLGRSAAVTAPAIKQNATAMADGAIGARAMGAGVSSLTGHLGGAGVGASAAGARIAGFSVATKGAGAAMAALANPAGIAVAAVVAVGAGFLIAANLASDYEKRIKKVTSTIALAGAQSSTTAKSVADSATNAAQVSGQSYDEITQASLKLIETHRFTADQVRDLTLHGANLAATFGLEVTDATDQVATAFDELGKGDVSALDDGFGFLSQSVRDNIIALLESGQTTEAQRAYLAALAQTLHGGPASLTTAFDNARSATADLIGAWLSSQGAIQTVQGWLADLAGSAESATNRIRAAANAGGSVAQLQAQYKGDIQNLVKARAANKPAPGWGPIRFDSEADDAFDKALASKRALDLAITRETPQVGQGSTAPFRPKAVKTPRAKVGRKAAEPKGSDALENFGERTAERIARIKGQFDDTSKAVDTANAAILETDRLIADLEKRKPPGFDQMIADAKALKPLIETSLRRPIAEMIADQGKQLNIGQAILANDQKRVRDLQFTAQLMDKLGVETEAQLVASLKEREITGDQVRLMYSQLDALEAQTREIEKQNERQQSQLGLVRGIEGAARDGLKDFANGDFAQAVTSTLDGVFDSLEQRMADKWFDDLFGDLFKNEEDRILGVDKVSQAGEQLARQVEGTSGSFDKAGDAATKLAEALKNAASSVAANANGEGDITVTGPGESKKDQDKSTKNTVKDILTQVFGEKFANILRDAMKGVVIGQAASGVAASLGIKQSKLGSQIGGAIGSAVAGPLGAIVGGLLGGTIGGLFKKVKTGSASLNYTDGAFQGGAVGGNNKALQGKSQSLVSGVGSSLASIADQLGGILTGAGRVSLGYDKKGRVVVDPTGAGRTKGGGVQNFGKDGEAAATAFATANAIADGAIEGLSAKVASALKSSSDLDRALSEAVKVQSLEDLLAGFGGSSRKVFIDFERQAKDRFRVASKYGFDLVKLEAARRINRTSDGWVESVARVSDDG